MKLNISEAAVSQHLKILKEAGLITGDKRGYFKHYQVNQAILKQLSIELNEMSETKKATYAQCPPSNKEDCPLCREDLIKDKKL